MRTTLLALSFSAVLIAAGPARGADEAPGPGPGPQEVERLYRKRCASCHRLRDPGERTRASWADVMGRMAARAHLSDAERAAVLSWLQSRASDGGAR
ncbi:c-type cytochrome [Anaeromyxobacter paludicola]|uniref:Cytochrome c domain-containing protein n=1 Tax=Anaeromyxobacter paludicola TaxID=2918171 RepID=A0ABM7X7I5_9BACT|nr:cytochrome c [Anaeromyxobacter paludicola]BDG07781.1 hypothetical protein AMPC_08940 [Anaeromyxobacter paludicola]